MLPPQVSTVAVEAESGRVVGVALCHVPTEQGGGEHDSPLMAALDPARDGVMMAVAQFLADLHIGLQVCLQRRNYKDITFKAWGEQ
jgi:hypothetical protein